MEINQIQQDLKFPKSLGFLREVSITGSIVIAITYIIMAMILKVNGFNPGEIWGYATRSTGIFTFIFTHAIYFGVGVTIMLQGVRMLIAEIIPAFKGIADKFVPRMLSSIRLSCNFWICP